LRGYSRSSDKPGDNGNGGIGVLVTDACMHASGGTHRQLCYYLYSYLEEEAWGVTDRC
jgi:hypothetical protein